MTWPDLCNWFTRYYEWNPQMLIDAQRALREFIADLMARFSRAAAFENSADNLGAALRWMETAQRHDLEKRKSQLASRLADSLTQRPAVAVRRRSERKESLRTRREHQPAPIHLVAAK